MEKMFFKSDRVMSQWDTWLHFHDGIYYLYYLAELNGKARWEGFGVACSSDGVSWEDKGVCLSASDKMVSFLGTGSVWRSPGFATDKTFICNYSEYHQVSEDEKVQRIFFATSKDLIHWEKCSDVVSDVDTRYYQKFGRWDCIYAIPKPDGGFYGTWTATPNGNTKNKGGIGFGTSTDGLHFTAIENKGVFPDCGESGAIERIDGTYYGMFGRGGKMFAYHAEDFSGPYHECPKNAEILSDYTYFSRFFWHGDELLVNHHCIPLLRNETGSSLCFMAPLKTVKIADGSLWLHYWEGNEKLKEQGMVRKDGFDPRDSFFIEGRIENGDAIQIGNGAMDTTITYRDGGFAIQDQKERVVRRDIALSGVNEIKILLKESVFEIYLNRVYMASHSMPQAFNGTLKSGDLTVWEIEE